MIATNASSDLAGSFWVWIMTAILFAANAKVGLAAVALRWSRIAVCCVLGGTYIPVGR
jgi:hypothetical protein